MKRIGLGLVAVALLAVVLLTLSGGAGAPAYGSTLGHAGVSRPGKAATEARIASAAPAPPAPQAWSVTVQGQFQSSRSYDAGNSDPTQNVTWTDSGEDDVQFNANFTLGSDGYITGSGDGHYTNTSYEISGVNGSNGSFDCPNVTVDGTPFTAQVNGIADGRTLNVDFSLPDAQELSNNTDCGAMFTSYGDMTTDIANSLQTALASVGGQLPVDMSDPSSWVQVLDVPVNTPGNPSEMDQNNWTFTFQHKCSDDVGTPGAGDGYINQFDAANALNLAYKGTACGPSSLMMAMDEFGPPPVYGPFQSPELTQIYNATLDPNHDFNWAEGQAEASSLGYGAQPLNGESEINNALSQGFPVLVSTTYSSYAPPTEGAGHVILITGRTFDGDYIVSDPAGDYYSSPSGHYGAGKCGDDVVYPESGVVAHLKGPALAIRGVLPHVGSNFRPAAAPHRATPQATPVLLITGSYAGASSRPSSLWVQDAQGRKAGWLPGGASVSEIPGSSAQLAPVDTINTLGPAGAIVPQREWPYAVLVRNPGADLKLHLKGTKHAHYALHILALDGGVVVQSKVQRGSIRRGQTTVTAIDVTPPRIRISAPRNGARLHRQPVVTGTASDGAGIRSVTYGLQNTRTGRWYDPRRRRFHALHRIALATRLHRRSAGRYVWTTALPARLSRGTYILAATAIDRAGNHQVIFANGVNVVRFTIR